MKAITLLLALAILLSACVDADDTVTATSQMVADDDNVAAQEVYGQTAGPDLSRTVSYISESKWDGWERSPERVKVVVRADEDRHTHYFESLPVAYGWLEERYDDYDIVELLVANALTGRDLLDVNDAFFLLSPGYEHALPMALAYPTRREAVLVQDRYPERYFLRSWNEVDDSMGLWRERYWDDWRDDFGFVRTASVTRYDGSFWDGWYDNPDRVLVRVARDGGLATHYFDSLPVAWSWLDDRYGDSRYEILDLQIAGADLPGRLLNARQATYLYMPDSADALPAVLAFATRDAAASALRALGDSGFRVLDWDGLTPRLSSWHEQSWNAWRGNPERNRGIARALESGLGRKLGLRDRATGVVAGEHRERERIAKDKVAKELKNEKSKAGAAKPAKSKDKDSGKSKARGSDDKGGKSGKKVKQREGKAKGADKRKSKGKGSAKSKDHGGGKDKDKDRRGGNGKGGGKK